MTVNEAAVKDWRAAAKHLCKVEPRFAPLVKTHGLPDMAPSRNLFASLGRSIIFQQLSGSAAGTIMARVKTSLGSPKVFPLPEALLAAPIEQLRAAGLSQAKVLALKDLSAHIVDGRLDLRRLRRAPHAELITALTAVRGIGPWSVDMFGMFALARPDVFAVGDLGVQKGMQRFLNLRQLPTPTVMAKRSAPWAPWRSAANWYMWRILEQA